MILGIIISILILQWTIHMIVLAPDNRPAMTGPVYRGEGNIVETAEFSINRIRASPVY